MPPAVRAASDTDRRAAARPATATAGPRRGRAATAQRYEGRGCRGHLQCTHRQVRTTCTDEECAASTRSIVVAAARRPATRRRLSSSPIVLLSSSHRDTRIQLPLTACRSVRYATVLASGREGGGRIEWRGEESARLSTRAQSDEKNMSNNHERSVYRIEFVSNNR
jgi:hypothetical protein